MANVIALPTIWHAATSSSKGGKGKKKDGSGDKSASVRDLETRLSRALGTRVYVRDQKGKGEIAIPYVDLDMLDRLLAKLIR